MKPAVETQQHLPSPHAPRDVAELIVSYLEQMGVDYVFGIPGGAVEPLYNALARSERRGGLRHITTRHEAGAAFMADGYARETGKLGVCIATSGPGATNLITGIACAYDNGVPVLALTGQPALPNFGRHALQESGCTGVNIIGMFRHCTRYNSLLSHVSQAETKLVSAIGRAMQMRGPAHLSIPVDVQRAPLTTPAQHYALDRLFAPQALLDERALQALIARLRTERNLVFLIGGGCGAAAPLVLAAAAALQAPVISTPDGKGLINPYHPLYRGVFGFGGHSTAAELLNDKPRHVIAVGTALGEWASGGWSEALLNERLIHVDACEDNLLRTPMADLHVRGDIGSIFERVLAALPEPEPAKVVPIPECPREDLEARPAAAQAIAPQILMRTLSRRCPPTTRFFADTGNSTAWAVHSLNLNDRRSRTQPASDERSTATRRPMSPWLQVTMDFAAMGWAIGASIGAAFADCNDPVVCLTGDGSYLMNGQEISVAQEAGLPVIFIVLNDGELGMVMHGQRLAGAESIAHQLPRTDFAMMARALGVNALSVGSEEELAGLDFAALFARRGPTLIDVRIDREQVPPMGVRMKVLRAGQ